MGKLLKFLFRLSIMSSIGYLIGTLAVQHATSLYGVPTHAEIVHKTNNAEHFLIAKQKKIIEKSRQSAVRVLSLSTATGNIASSSGTYITLRNNYFIITTNHGIVGECETTRIVADDEIYNCINFIEKNEEIDYALIQIEKIENRKAIKIPQDVARTKRDWLDALSILARTYYTGFPNSIGPLTIDGKIMGHGDDDYIYINSYAWSGSSGSGVFSQRGDYIGFVLAIDVGSAFDGPAILENVVLVVPAYKINWASIFNAPPLLPESQDTAIYTDTEEEE